MGAAYIKTVFLTNADTGIPAVGSGNYFVEPLGLICAKTLGIKDSTRAIQHQYPCI